MNIYKNIFKINKMFKIEKIITTKDKNEKLISSSIEKNNDPVIIFDDENNSRIFCCKICPFTTKRSFNYDRHLKTHFPEKDPQKIKNKGKNNLETFKKDQIL